MLRREGGRERGREGEREGGGGGVRSRGWLVDCDHQRDVEEASFSDGACLFQSRLWRR
jgi:hypothetical protein